MNEPTGTPPTRCFTPLLSLLLAGALTLSGCASVPPPKAELAVARNAVNTAVSAGGTELAPVEMRSAQDKLNGAENAMTQEEYTTARYLAEEAAVDAQLAERKARARKVQNAVDDARRGIEVLRQEMQRSTSSPAGTQQ